MHHPESSESLALSTEPSNATARELAAFTVAANCYRHSEHAESMAFVPSDTADRDNLSPVQQSQPSSALPQGVTEAAAGTVVGKYHSEPGVRKYHPEPSESPALSTEPSHATARELAVVASTANYDRNAGDTADRDVLPPVHQSQPSTSLAPMLMVVSTQHPAASESCSMSSLPSRAMTADVSIFAHCLEPSEGHGSTLLTEQSGFAVAREFAAAATLDNSDEHLENSASIVSSERLNGAADQELAAIVIDNSRRFLRKLSGSLVLSVLPSDAEDEETSEKDVASAKAAGDEVVATKGTAAALKDEEQMVASASATAKQANSGKAEDEALEAAATVEASEDEMVNAQVAQDTAARRGEAATTAKDDEEEEAVSAVDEAEAEGAAAADHAAAAARAKENAFAANKAAEDKAEVAATTVAQISAATVSVKEVATVKAAAAATEADERSAGSWPSQEVVTVVKDDEGVAAKAAEEQEGEARPESEALAAKTVKNAFVSAEGTAEATAANAAKEAAGVEAAAFNSEDDMVIVQVVKDTAARLGEKVAGMAKDEDAISAVDEADAEAADDNAVAKTFAQTLVPTSSAEEATSPTKEAATSKAEDDEVAAIQADEKSQGAGDATAFDDKADAINFEKEFAAAEAFENAGAAAEALDAAAIAAHVAAQEIAVVDVVGSAEIQAAKKQARLEKAGRKVLATLVHEDEKVAATVIMGRQVEMEDETAAARQTWQSTESAEAVEAVEEDEAAKASFLGSTAATTLSFSNLALSASSSTLALAATAEAKDVATAARVGGCMAAAEEKKTEEAAASTAAEAQSKVAAQADIAVEYVEDTSVDLLFNMAVAKATAMVEAEATCAVAMQPPVLSSEVGAEVATIARDTTETDKSVTEGQRAEKDHEDNEDELLAAEDCGADRPLRVQHGTMPISGDTMPYDTERVITKRSSMESPEIVSVQLPGSCRTLGLALQQRASQAGQELVVVEVFADGAVAAHNAEQLASRRKDKLVKPGMRLAGVNGVERDLTTLLKALVAEHVADVVFVKVERAPAALKKMKGADGAAMAVRAIQEQMSDALRGEFMVRLQKGSQGLGLTFKAPSARRRKRQELLIVDVDPEGAVADHNIIQHLAGRNNEVIKSGMHIMAVNGVAEDASAMMEALSENYELELRVRSESSNVVELVQNRTAKAVHTVKAVRAECFGFTR
eukprot:TRINITY_DN2680_c0_g2_i2.p1 TRINITY_DN2680_c0_g2~~TRINITY_DN2680_c0_g2_i2.p1  ORF type:complete len:1192 (+),score=341.55 TRINITY_DN2680_c0_g2_i2:3-3578(+)